ncbi:MAG: NAD(P)/FAD-dependent oxidoreductase [Patescibacteria group bacterium]
MIQLENNNYNLAVIGGGPSGMMAAGRAAEKGARVVLVEKNNQLGIKLLMTGGKRCNITNAEEDLQKLIKVYGKNGRFLYSALNKFSNKDVIDFFGKYGLKTKMEKDNRVFTVSDNSKEVVDCLEKYLKKNNVEIKYNSTVEKFILKNKKIVKAILKTGDEIVADNFVLATGGKSYPDSGSSGDAYKWLEQMGHTIVEPRPALTPIIVKEKIVKRLEGLSLKDAEVSLWDKKKLCSYIGETVFTSNGLSGPVILNLSKYVSEYNSKDINKLKIKIDFQPELNYPALDLKIQKEFAEQKNKQIKNCLNKLLPNKLIPVIIELSEIEATKQINEITKIERKKLLKLIKEFEFSVQGVAGFNKAVITSGGVDLKEVDPKTMKSKIIDNLYFGGEILDIDGPTGGYNLQVAWSTGYLVGENSR